MTLIKSISGIRGTVGGKAGEGLSPLDAVKFTAAFSSFLQKRHQKQNLCIVLGRDARISGEMYSSIVASTLNGMGINVIDLGLSTTPTVEMAVVFHQADGGIILTASHNPAQWNALKLLNEKGEFISSQEGADLLEAVEKEDFEFAEVDKLGKITKDDTAIEKHIQSILDLPLVDKELIKKANFKIAVDCVNSTGGISIVPLLKSLGVQEIIELYCTPNGNFPHNPEPLPENLIEISERIKTDKADLGFVVDPDVDRLAIVCENGSMFGEEYTLVSVSDYILSQQKGNTVSNLSSTRALRDLTEKHGGNYFASAVGEVNVVEKMKTKNAIIGGEGNGGIIYPELHYGRDALVGIALFLTHLAKKQIKVSELRAEYPSYYISKNKIQLSPDTDVNLILEKIKEKYENRSDVKVNTIDGVKIDFENSWIHLRKSNTEPIIRIYSEAKNMKKAEELAQNIMFQISDLS